VSLTDEAVAAATLVCLPQMTPARLRTLLAHRGALSALEEIRAGRAEAILQIAQERSRVVNFTKLANLWKERSDPEPIRRRLQQRRTQVWLSDRADYPIVDDLPSRPAVLLGEGSNHEQLKGPRVAIVGTRSATPHGLADARELGNYLANAGVVVISGLAIGIDAAAHEGVLEAGGVAIGVVATGLDVVYPRRHELLYQRVRNSGVIISEQGFGVGPRRGLFPIRNRIIAALADVVIVMEATIKGGARITAQYALEYGRTVMAVPGSRRNAAAAGTNALIADGAHPLIEWSDVLLALGLSSATSARALSPDRPPPSKAGRALLLALGGEAATTDQLISRSGLTVSATALALRELERHHWVVRAQGAILAPIVKQYLPFSRPRVGRKQNGLLFVIFV